MGDSITISCIGSTLWRDNWGEKYNEHKYVKTIKEYIKKYESKEDVYIPHWELLYIKRTTSNKKDVVRFWLPDDCWQYSGPELYKTYWELSFQSFKNIFLKD